ncbi:two-component sensor histidine kinase [Comamonas sp. Y33R10-2]|uniref:histidine kinase dimerization/phospho-acceptor domain-containing protein n=1 Tax=Comamonas sp. Y33R10-2 TaxID=2853257 RepID=UPI001C5CB18F|nr:histidine kinase dimerization/phospho-acceptor domain-containing protein [Comamonas sp. Y33R10-2]QXZ08600.1 two-component sensor histidine kinase [Comamonas sp. Y33R10-2]
MSTAEQGGKRRSSLQLTLLAWVLAALALVWGSFVVWGYQTGVTEADELTDGHLASVASLTLNWHVQGDVPVGETTAVQPLPGLHAHDYQESLSVVLWNDKGVLISRTGKAPLPAFDLEQGFATIDTDSQHSWRSFTQWSQDKKAKVTVMISLAERDSLADDIAVQMIEPGFWLLPIIVIALGVAVRRGMRPLNQVTQRVQALDLSRAQRVSDANVPQELSPMVSAINTLLDRQQEALERERNLANEVAHELRTPLASIALQAQALKSDSQAGTSMDHAAMQAALQRIGQDALHAGHVLDQLLTLARAGRGMLDAPLQSVNWADTARNVAAAQAQIAWQREDSLAVDAPACVTVRGNPLLLDSALRNLVENAVRHTPTGTQIEVQVGCDEFLGLAWVQVCDDGRRDVALAHVPPVDSLHLGHEIVSRVMQAHGGRFMQTDAPQGFTTCYRMEIPSAG